MRRATAINGDIKIIYPDELCFAFNPNYIEIESSKFTYFKVRVYLGIGTGNERVRLKEITVHNYSLRTKVYLSRLFQLMFEEPECVRSLPLVVSIGNESYSYFSFTTLVLWGGLAPGERFNALGVYADDGKKRQYERTLIWFKKFPFCVSVFKYKSDVAFRGRYDNSQYGDSPLLPRGIWAIDGIDEFTVPPITEGTITSPAQVIYFASIRKFIGMTSIGQYFQNWTGGHSYGNSSDDLMDPETGLPRTDRDYLLMDGDGLPWLYRFDGCNLVKAGMSQDRGFELLYPDQLFPDAKHSVVIRYNSADLVNSTSTFDDTFDYTFGELNDTVSMVRLIVCNEMEGHYLRWIDSQGNVQFFLFKNGARTTKTSLGSDSLQIEEPIRNMHFPNLSRTQNVEHTVTHKCCAVHLPDKIYCWVKTILTSPIIDKYLGKDKEGNEIWVPVNIVAGNTDYNPKRNLNDLEISFTVPVYNSQSL